MKKRAEDYPYSLLTNLSFMLSVSNDRMFTIKGFASMAKDDTDSVIEEENLEYIESHRKVQ